VNLNVPPAPSSSASRRDASEQSRLDTLLTELFETRITFNQTLGLKVMSLDVQEPRVRFDMRPALVGHYVSGRLHGGVISAVLDATAGLAVMVAILEKHADEPAEEALHRLNRLGTIDLRVDFLRQGVGSFFVASAQVARLGGRVASTQMRLTNDADELIATGSAAYILT
jgi:uncharacterized protein (TIGR00369 family)